MNSSVRHDYSESTPGAAPVAAQLSTFTYCRLFVAIIPDSAQLKVKLNYVSLERLADIILPIYSV